MGQRTRLCSALLSLLAGACTSAAESPPPGAPDVHCAPQSLVDLHAFVALEAGDDPFADRLPDAHCDVVDYGFELFGGDESFFVNTGKCTYITASQPSLVALKAGDSVDLRVWHFQLASPEPAEAHVALRIGDHLMLDRKVPIPSGSGLDALTWTAPRDLPAGTPISFHVHNHGSNSWSLLEVARTRCD